MSTAFTGDAKDAYVIGETVRLRRDLPVIDTVTDLTRELALLTAHRTDLVRTGSGRSTGSATS